MLFTSGIVIIITVAADILWASMEKGYTFKRIIHSFLHSLKGKQIFPAGSTHPMPDISKLKPNNIPVISQDEFSKKEEDINDVRKLLNGLLKIKEETGMTFPDFVK